jgi:hypothetical protein
MHLLELYWVYVRLDPFLVRIRSPMLNPKDLLWLLQVHPSLPLLYKPLFMRQFLSASSSAKPARISRLLLLAMFSVAARYSSLVTKEKPERAKYWGSGDDFAESAKKMLAQDDGSSRLTTVQALLLLSYREMGMHLFPLPYPAPLKR